MRDNFARHWYIARDYFLRPGIAALLPWKLGFKLLKYWARKPSFRDRQHLLAFEQAKIYCPDLVEQVFLQARRLTTLVDDTDMFLTFTRSDRWMKKHVSIEGAELPTDVPSTILDYHWGAGTWFIRHMRAIKLSHTGLAFKLNFKQLNKLSPLISWNAKLRYYDMDRHPCSHLVLQPSDTFMSEVRKGLRENNSLFYLYDVPPTEKGRTLKVRFFGKAAQFPRGMLSLSRTRQLPVYAVWTDFDRNSGRRHIKIHGPIDGDSEEALAQQLTDLLEESIRKDPANWHMWAAMPRFIPANSAEKSTAD